MHQEQCMLVLKVSKGLGTGCFNVGDLKGVKLWWNRSHVSYEKEVSECEGLFKPRVPLCGTTWW